MAVATLEPVDAPPAADVEARDRIVLSNQGLVASVARGFRGRGLPMADLVAYGQIGLIRAAEEFDPERGYRFSTYAVFWIRRALHNATLNAEGPIRVDGRVRREGHAVLARCRELGVDPAEAVRTLSLTGPKATAKRRQLIAAAFAVAGHSVGSVEHRRDLAPGSSPLDALILEEQREQLALALPLLSSEHRNALEGPSRGPGGRRKEAEAVAELRRLLRQGAVEPLRTRTRPTSSDQSWGCPSISRGCRSTAPRRRR